MQLNFLIEKASSIAGSQNKLATMLEANRTHVSMWKSGARPCTPKTRAAIAAIAGEDVAQAAVEGVLEGLDLTTQEGKLAADGLKEALANWRKRLLSLLGFTLGKTPGVNYPSLII